jgi:hypothetical protein
MSLVRRQRRALVVAVGISAVVVSVSPAVARSDKARLLARSDVPADLSERTVGSGDRVVGVPSVEDSVCHTEEKLAKRFDGVARHNVAYSRKDDEAGLVAEFISDFADRADAQTYFGAWKTYARKVDKCAQVVQVFGKAEGFHGKVRRLPTPGLRDDSVALRTIPRGTKQATGCQAEVRGGTTVVDVRWFDPRGVNDKGCRNLFARAVERARL